MRYGKGRAYHNSGDNEHNNSEGDIGGLVFGVRTSCFHEYIIYNNVILGNKHKKNVDGMGEVW